MAIIEVTQSLGIIMQSYKGEHDPNLVYKKHNIVTNSQGSSFICIQTTIVGTPLTDEYAWQFLAKGSI